MLVSFPATTDLVYIGSYNRADQQGLSEHELIIDIKRFFVFGKSIISARIILD